MRGSSVGYSVSQRPHTVSGRGGSFSFETALCAAQAGLKLGRSRDLPCLSLPSMAGATGMFHFECYRSNIYTLKTECLTSRVQSAFFLLGLTKTHYINYSALGHKGRYCNQTRNQVKMLPFQVYAIFQLPNIRQSFQQFLFLLPAI